MWSMSDVGSLRFGFLRVKGVDLRFHEHACENQVLEHLNSP